MGKIVLSNPIFITTKTDEASQPYLFKKKGRSLVGLEIQAILRKGVMQMVEDSQYQVLSLTFLVEKKDSRCKTFVMFISDWKFSHFKGDSSDQIFYANYT